MSLTSPTTSRVNRDFCQVRYLNDTSTVYSQHQSHLKRNGINKCCCLNPQGKNKAQLKRTSKTTRIRTHTLDTQYNHADFLLSGKGLTLTTYLRTYRPSVRQMKLNQQKTSSGFEPQQVVSFKTSTTPPHPTQSTSPARPPRNRWNQKQLLSRTYKTNPGNPKSENRGRQLSNAGMWAPIPRKSTRRSPRE